MQIDMECWRNGQVGRLPGADNPQTLIFAFGASNLLDDPQLLVHLAAERPNCHIVGCSTAGEIFQDTVDDDTLSIAAIHFDHTQVRTACAPVESGSDSHDAGAALGKQLVADGLRAVLILSEGERVNGSELVRGINSVLPAGVTVTGGLAGDGDRVERTWVIREGVPTRHCVTAVGLYGDRVHVGHGSRGGWDLFGPERRITRSEGNVLYELDGRPALQLYKEYLGERADGLPAAALLFPLAIRPSGEVAESVTRTVLSVDEAAQSMTFAGDVPHGHMAQLMMANFDRLIEAASLAAEETHAVPLGDVLCLAISCVGRRLILGERTEEELEATLEVLPAGAKQVGFYSYGEISPLTDGTCSLHNQTMTLTTICETG